MPDEVKLLPCPRCKGTGTVHGMAEDEWGACMASWPCEHCTRPPIGTDEVVETRVSRALYDVYAGHDYANGSVWAALARAAIAAMKDAASD